MKSTVDVQDIVKRNYPIFSQETEFSSLVYARKWLEWCNGGSILSHRQTEMGDFPVRNVKCIASGVSVSEHEHLKAHKES
jgi:hypothetical protein